MLYEKMKLVIHKIVWFVLLLLGIIIPLILINPSTKDVKLIEDKGYIEQYYEYIDSTTCRIELIFNKKIEEGYMKVAFFDEEGNQLKVDEDYCFATDKKLSATFYIDGKVDSYDVLEYDFSIISSSTEIMIIEISFIVDIFIFAFFISSLFLSVKYYRYEDNEIIVYAGWYHHYIKVNGIKMDEHNTMVSYVAIELSCSLNDGTNLSARISRMNRISLKVNNQLYREMK